MAFVDKWIRNFNRKCFDIQ